MTISKQRMNRRRLQSWVWASVLLAAWTAAAAESQPTGRTSTAPGMVIRVRQDAEGDMQGDSDEVLQKALDRLQKEGGGTLRIGPGVWRLHRGLSVRNVRGLRIIGEPGAILKAASQPGAHTRTPAEKGARSLEVDNPAFFKAGMAVELHTPGRAVTAPSGKTFRQPFIMARVQRIDGARLVLDRPLPVQAPAGVIVLGVFNGITIHSPAEDVLVANLTIDMNRDAWPVAPKNHTYHCCIFASGPYSYNKGPTGPAVERLRIIGCELRNAHHRGVAFYSVRHSGVYDCTIENTSAEGIDLDHFCTHCEAVNNTLRHVRNIELNDASYCLVSGNLIDSPSVGIVIWQWCKLPDLNVGNLACDNRIHRSGGHGIYLQRGADRNLILGNRIKAAEGLGVLVEGRNNILIENLTEGCKRGDLRVAPKAGNIVLSAPRAE